jgi:primosomal protein N' (replication factor Y)
LGPAAYVALTADVGPERRYRRWLAARRGDVRVVVGTRGAAFAPVADLGLVVIWDDGDDLHAEPRAPYPHAREVLLLRAQGQGAAALIGGYAVTAEGAELVRTGWARALRPSRAAVRQTAPRVRTGGGDDDLARDTSAVGARLPTIAWSTARDALGRGPVLIQVPRAGYVPALACAHCREPARCASCHGPMAIADVGGSPTCRWCGRPAPGWHCAECGGAHLRAPVIGARRTAEEIGRAFPSFSVVISGGARVVPYVADEPAIVVATTGSEPVARAGYAAALILDGWLLLARPELRAAEEALRRWMAAAALVRPVGQGGVVILMAEPHPRPVQALVRWDPFGHAERELADRRGAGLPPVARLAAVTGEEAAVRDLLDCTHLPANAEVLGSVATPEGRRALIRAPRRSAAGLAAALHAGLALRSARKAPGSVRVRMDPADFL